eukprot:CAMPEP_0114986550 /NCGR_PEP_ID=MMETSP0216-20121206/8488_1 /TAXON_ID=223996 /ORGANISM="Protocruzia adherens, Strain Boccale" /LENGTH=545 /DNA_ID=CAMNT_0002348997 /DNA_START=40 /DNA_END=1677 /DNA_ORIENTATION=+
MEPKFVEEFQKLNQKYSRIADKKYSYSVSGLRSLGTNLQNPFMRIGLFTTLLSRKYAKTMGIMITASHNAACDNGVKVIATDGGMLGDQDSVMCQEFVNSDTPLDFLRDTFGSDVAAQDYEGDVWIGNDTRDTSLMLKECLCAGASLLKANIKDFGVVTTPQLHWLVQQNFNGEDDISLDHYWNRYVDAFTTLNTLTAENEKYWKDRQIFVDGADGVGGYQVSGAKNKFTGLLDFELVNDSLSENAVVNEDCGAEHVQKGQTIPKNFDDAKFYEKKCASFDGDADRLVYFYLTKEGAFNLIDGDRIAILYSTLIQKLLNVVLEDEKLKEPAQKSGIDWKLSVVQTAYANGSSTKYLKEKLGIDSTFVRTGVKHLHHEAIQHDISVYFEANGHGTFYLSPRVVDFIEEYKENSREVGLLKILLELTNTAIGDAIADVFLAEAAMAILNLDLTDVIALYTDLYSANAKTVVNDKSAIKTSADDMAVVFPEGIQGEIDQVVAKYPSTRAFVRPSGTEDIVRLYAEGPEEKQLPEIIVEITELIKKYNI